MSFLVLQIFIPDNPEVVIHIRDLTNFLTQLTLICFELLLLL